MTRQLAILVGLLTAGLAAPTLAQNFPEGAKFKTAVGCAGCHTKEPQDFDRIAILKQYKKYLPFTAFNEGLIWGDKDLHSQAYAVLNGDRAKKMGELLKIADVSKERSCLTCHAVDPMHGNFEPGAEEGILAEGVGCEACHGPSSLWDGPHRLPDWRNKPSAEKTALGMVDVRDPILRMRNCLSCHMGNVKENKIITHEMYAAGHPPLPSFEIESFADNMPRHWRYLTEKTGLSEDERKQLQYNKDELARTKRVAIGGLIALSESMKLLADRAETDQDKSPWPALAEFDCGACHHDLRHDNWRQRRGYAAVPGRPLMRSWPNTLIDIGWPGTDGLQEQLKPLATALSSQPFGEPKEVVKAAREIQKWADELATKLNTQLVDAKSAGELYEKLARRGETELLDYDSARQLAWSLIIINRELGDAGSKDKAALDDLAKELQLQRPVDPALTPDKKWILVTLSAQLKNRADYEPAKVQELFARLGKAPSQGPAIRGAQ